MALIKKPKAKPWLAFLLNLIGLGGLGYMYLGQTRKGIAFGLATLLLLFFCLGAVIPFIAAYDAYLLAKALEAGVPVRHDENALEFLNNVFE